MTDGNFAKNATKYWDRGLSALPIAPKTKRPVVNSWQSYQANLPSQSRRDEWRRDFADHGIGVNLGTEVLKDFQLAGIDIDDDKLVPPVEALLGETVCGKRGKKGRTIFVRIAKSEGVKSTTIKGSGSLGNIDVLVGGRQTVLPPTIHPDTGKPYQWIGTPLLEVDFDGLPNVDQRKLDVLAKAVGSEHLETLMSGQSTHDAGLAFVAELVSVGATDEEIHALVSGALPKSYNGNSLKELPGWIESARNKGFDLYSNDFDYDPGDTLPKPLGFTREGSFAVLDQKRGIALNFSAQQLQSHQVLIGLAPSRDWGRHFPSDKGRFASAHAGEALIRACEDAGPFDPTTVRGQGVWTEGEKVIENFGSPVEDGLVHRYVAFSPVAVERGDSFGVHRLRELARSFTFRDPGNADLLLGWLAMSPVCGALDWRPHAFLYGPPATGKTTLHNLAAKILSPLVVSADGQSTEAGLRQRLGPDAMPIVLDEFETDSNQTRLQGIMRLARSASSADSPVLRGTPEGKAIQFSIRTMMLCSAVNVVGMTPADQSRFVVMELVPHGSNPETGAHIEREVAHFAKLGPSWCGYVVRLAPKIIKAIDIVRSAALGMDSRQARTFGSLLAAQFVALERRVPTEDEAAKLIARYAQTIDLHRVDQNRDNGRECLDHLLAHPIRSHEHGELPLSYWLGVVLARLKRGEQGERGSEMGEAERTVANLQIRFLLDGDQQGVLLRNGAPPIDKIFEGTLWAKRGWERALGQLPGAFKPKNPQRFPGVSDKHRCIGLPLEMVPPPIYDPAGEEEF